MTIPTGDVTRVKTHHLVRANNHILDRLVQRVTDVQMTVRIGRAIMQGKRCAARFFAQAIIDVHLFPTGQPFRFTFGQSCTHREIGFRQVQCGLIFWGLGAHLVASFGSKSGILVGAVRVAQTPIYRRLTGSERRGYNSYNDLVNAAHTRLIGRWHKAHKPTLHPLACPAPVPTY